MVIMIDKDKCDRNRMCVIVSACPVGAIKQKKIGPILADYPEIDEEKCTECGICIKECPHGAAYKE